VFVLVLTLMAAALPMGQGSFASPDPRRWSLAGKRILVTGGTLGIGKAIVEECAALGAEVLTCARNEDVLKSCLSEWAAQGFNVRACVADIGSTEGRETVLQLVAEVSGQHGIDAVVNNVGTNIRKRAIEYNEQEYNKIMNTNLHSTFHLTRTLYPFLKKASHINRKGAAVVNIGSVAGMYAFMLGETFVC
jgi:tropinone reductase I